MPPPRSCTGTGLGFLLSFAESSGISNGFVLVSLDILVFILQQFSVRLFFYVGKRKGQRTFRARAVKKAGCCEATLSDLLFATDACHIKPHSICSEIEQEDPNNSILLLASIHRAFDEGLISFDVSGKIIISESLSKWEWECLGLSGNEQIRMPGQRPLYMEYHRKNIFKDEI